MSPKHAIVALALVFASCGGGAAAPDPSVVAVAKVADCMKSHGMSAPNDKVDPPQPTIRGDSTTIFRSCDWPQPAYAATDGYTEIRVTRVPWSEKAEVTMASAPDRVESPCAEVELQYTFAKQSSPQLQEAIRFTAGTRALITGQPFIDSLPFRSTPTDIVVVHNLSYSIVAARCLR
jgi:hypothetical protein